MIYQSILSAAPLRISFVGGGTDISSFYSKFGGEVISASINKYVYVHIKDTIHFFKKNTGFPILKLSILILETALEMT